MMKILKLIFIICVVALPFVGKAQIIKQPVMIVFAEDNNIQIPYKFMRSDADEKYDSLPMRFITLKYLFYTSMSERLASNAFKPIGGVSTDINTERQYKTSNWFSTDSVLNAKNKGKKYYSSIINQNNIGQYSMYMNADSAAYLILINKIEIHSDIFRRNILMYNYFMDVHFDVYNRDMKLIGGRYLRKKLRLNKNMYWSAFSKMFTGMPDELALYFINMKK
jgi:hypothetical protein